jgi:hypothetical protein
MSRKIFFVNLFIFFHLNINAQSLDTIAKNYLNFIGGKKNWTKVKTIVTTGEYDYGGISFPFKTYSKAPNKYKFKVESSGKYYAQAFDGTKGWKIDAFKNETQPTILTGPDAKDMANESTVELMDVFLRSKIDGKTMAYSGKDSVKSHLCYRIKVFEDPAIETYYFDTNTYELVMKKTTSRNVELNKAPMNIYYSDYRDIGGIKIPFKTICESDSQTILVITINYATLDEPIDDKEFQP